MSDKIEIKYSKEKVKITLLASHFVRAKLSTIENYVDATTALEEEGTLSLIYDKPKYSDSLSELVKGEMTEAERLELAQKMGILQWKESDFKIPYIHPKNIFVQGNIVKILHYGLIGIMEPMDLNEQTFLATYKALIVSILRPKLNFDLLIDGISSIRDQLVQDIDACKTYDEVLQYINKAYTKITDEIKAKKVVVMKRNWYIFTIGTVVSGITTIILGILSAYFYFWVSPVQKATVDAQGHFIARRYDDVADDLRKFQIIRLSKEAKYVLASSYIHLDNLSDKQKLSILNTITPSSSENLLEYWIYLGRGNYKKALNLAQNIGDNQLILHSYTNLYEQVRNDPKMDGAEKQKKLSEYLKEIKDLSNKLGVKVSEVKNE